MSSTQTPKTRVVEYFRCWSDHTWDTELIDVPADTPEDQLNEAVIAAASQVDWAEEPPCLVGLYSAMDDEDDDEYPDDWVDLGGES